MGPIAGEFITALLGFIIIYSLSSFSGLISERSGVVNIALDGKMIIGALVFASLYQIPEFTDTLGFATPFVAIIIAGLVTSLYSTLLSLATINFMADQVIAGTALNMLSPALSLLIMKTAFNSDTITGIDANLGTWAGTMNEFIIVMFLITILIMVGAWFFISKTSYGLRLKSAGENPYALETAGVSVKKTRWIALTVAGFLSGVAGSIFPIITSGTFGGTVNGSGFISLAILIVGQWSVIGISIVAVIFSSFSAIASSWTSIFDGSAIPFELINIIPFIIPIVVLVIFKSSNGPSAVGKPYKKDMR